MYILDELKVGLALSCQNCTKTATVQEDNHVPEGWFYLGDYLDRLILFCCSDCALHFIESKKSKTSKAPLVQRDSIFPRNL